jgi:hypothetical protein
MQPTAVVALGLLRVARHPVFRRRPLTAVAHGLRVSRRTRAGDPRLAARSGSFHLADGDRSDGRRAADHRSLPSGPGGVIGGDPTGLFGLDWVGLPKKPRSERVRGFGARGLGAAHCPPGNSGSPGGTSLQTRRRCREKVSVSESVGPRANHPPQAAALPHPGRVSGRRSPSKDHRKCRWLTGASSVDTPRGRTMLRLRCAWDVRKANETSHESPADWPAPLQAGSADRRWPRRSCRCLGE